MKPCILLFQYLLTFTIIVVCPTLQISYNSKLTGVEGIWDCDIVEIKLTFQLSAYQKS